MKQQELNITLAERDGTTVLTLTGRIDLHGAEKMRAACREAVAAGAADLVLDLSRVPFVSSTGLGSFLVLQQEQERRGRRVVFAGLQPAPRHVLEVLNLAPYLELAEDVPAALARLGTPEPVPAG